MAKTKKAKSLSSEASESEGEPPDEILFDEMSGSSSNGGIDFSLQEKQAGSQGDIGDLVVWVSEDPAIVKFFDRLGLGEYSQYAMELGPGSEYSDRIGYA